MKLSKKYLCTVALALLCAAVFPSCKGDGGEDQPTPPPAEEKSLIASLTVMVEDLTDASKSEVTAQYAYDKEGRVSSIAFSAKSNHYTHNETWSITYGNGTISASTSFEPLVLKTNASGYIIGDTSGDESYFFASYDSEGQLLSFMVDDADEFYTFKWKGDLISERQFTNIESEGSITLHTTFTYSKVKDPAGLMVLYIPELTNMLLPGAWFGKTPTYLPSKSVNTFKVSGSSLPAEMTTTYDYTLDAKGRPTKIVTTDDLQSKSKDITPESVEILRTTFTITYK